MSLERKATAIAHPNIALVKYWGKRDEALILPHHSSLSLTFGPMQVQTTVQFGVVQEAYELNGRPASLEERRRIKKVLDVLRVGRELGPARVCSKGDFPTAAGFASSAAGFAALAVAARAAVGLPPSDKEASILARLGSGSACRSIQGGVCVWKKGERADGLDSYAEQRLPEDFWPSLRLLLAVVNDAEKKVSSRDGMRLTVQGSPFYPAWAQLAEHDVAVAEGYLRERNLPALGALAESNALRMHATALGAQPPVVYFEAGTLSLYHRLVKAREEGLRAWMTLDAGPNPVLLYEVADEKDVVALARASGARDVRLGQVAKAAHLTQTHLF